MKDLYFAYRVEVCLHKFQVRLCNLCPRLEITMRQTDRHVCFYLNSCATDTAMRHTAIVVRASSAIRLRSSFRLSEIWSSSVSRTLAAAVSLVRVFATFSNRSVSRTWICLRHVTNRSIDKENGQDKRIAYLSVRL